MVYSLVGIIFVLIAVIVFLSWQFRTERAKLLDRIMMPDYTTFKQFDRPMKGAELEAISPPSEEYEAELEKIRAEG